MILLISLFRLLFRSKVAFAISEFSLILSSFLLILFFIILIHGSDFLGTQAWAGTRQRGQGSVFLAEDTARGSQCVAEGGPSRRGRKFGLAELWLTCLSPLVFDHCSLLQTVPASLFLHRSFQNLFFSDSVQHTFFLSSFYCHSSFTRSLL